MLKHNFTLILCIQGTYHSLYLTWEILLLMCAVWPGAYAASQALRQEQKNEKAGTKFPIVSFNRFSFKMWLQSSGQILHRLYPYTCPVTVLGIHQHRIWSLPITMMEGSWKVLTHVVLRQLQNRKSLSFKITEQPFTSDTGWCKHCIFSLWRIKIVPDTPQHLNYVHAGTTEHS